jgi:thiol-disulfide isomerase/thioredoxin
MRWSSFDRRIVLALGLAVLPAETGAFPTQPAGDEGGPRPSAKSSQPSDTDTTAEAIHEAIDREIVRLEQQRLERLARLASRQAPPAAAATYDQLFRAAIAANLFRDAEPAADTVIRSGGPSPAVVALAHLVKIIAEADRGAYEESLESLRRALARKPEADPTGSSSPHLQADEIVGICEAYYQRLLEGDQFEIARRAFRLALEASSVPAVRDFLESRLKRLELVGKPAPPIEGTDLDGRPFRLADHQGKVVLVVFWASWCLPCAAEVAWIQQVERTYRPQGFQVIGINVDILQNGGEKLETVLPNIRRFILDQNIGWPNLIDGMGNRDYAAAYGVTDIPANALIGRDGKVIHLDLGRRNLQTVVARAVAHSS